MAPAAVSIPRAFASIAEIENLLIRLGRDGIKGNKHGRQSNYEHRAQLREAVRDPTSTNVVGRILQHVTPDRNAPFPKVDPRTVFFYLEEENTGRLYLLKTCAGGGSGHTNKYNVYLDNGKYTTDGWIWGLQNSTGRLVRNGVAVYPTAPNNLAPIPVPVSVPVAAPVSSSTSAPQARTSQGSSSSSSSLATSSSDSAIDNNTQPTTSAPASAPNTRASTRSRARSARPAPTVSQDEDHNEEDDEVPALLSAASRSNKATSKENRSRSTRSNSSQPLSLSKSFAGVKKTERKTRKLPSVRSNNNKEDEDEDEFDNVVQVKTSKDTKAPSKHVGGGRSGTRSGISSNIMPSETFAKRSEVIKPASAANPLILNPESKGKKRKRGDDGIITNDQVHKRFKHFVTGWNIPADHQQQHLPSSTTGSLSLVGANITELVPVQANGKPEKAMHMGGGLAQYTMDDKRKLIRFKDGASVYGLEFPAGKTLQTTVPNPASIKRRSKRPALDQSNATLARLDKELEQMNNAKDAEEKKLLSEEKKAFNEKVRQAMQEARRNLPDPGWDW